MLLPAAIGFWSEYGDAIESLLLWASGIAMYGLAVAFFYQLLSRRRMFAPKGGTDPRQTGALAFLYVLAFPFISFGFFLVISSALLLLTDPAVQLSERDAVRIFTIAMAIVLAVRIVSYFTEVGSNDMAKMLPLGLLTVYLVDAELVRDFSDAVEQLNALRDHIGLVGVFFAIVVLVEFLLQFVYQMARSRGPAPPNPPKLRAR